MASVIRRPHTRADGSNGDKWTVRYFDEKGVRRSKGFDLKKDAEAFKRKVGREIDDGTHVADRETMTVEAAVAEYVRFNYQRASDGRIGIVRAENVEAKLKKFCLEIGNIPLNKLQMVDVERLFGTLCKQLKPTTARDQLGALKLVQDYALKRKWLKSRPVDEALRELRGMPRERVRVPTPDEIRAIIKAAETKTPKGNHQSRAALECIVHLAAFCGLRLGEILGLKPEHVHLDAGVIEVRHSLLQNGTLKGPKTKAGVRDVPVPSHVRPLLRAYIDRYVRPQVKNRHGLIFRTRTGGELHAGPFNVHWQVLLLRAGAGPTDKSVHFHALRHFYASWLIRNGVPLTDIAKLLGHSKFDVTLQVYAHPIMDKVAQSAAIEQSTLLLLADA